MAPINTDQRRRRFWSGYFVGESKDLAFTLLWATIFVALLTAIVNLWYCFEPYFYKEWKKDQEKSLKDEDEDVKQSYISVASIQFYARYIFYSLVALSLPICVFVGLQQKSRPTLNFFSGCGCCCAFFSFLVSYSYVFNCDYKAQYCTPLRAANVIAFLIYLFVVYTVVQLLHRTLGSGTVNTLPSQRFNFYPSFIQTAFYSPSQYGSNQTFNVTGQQNNNNLNRMTPEEPENSNQRQQVFSSWWSNSYPQNPDGVDVEMGMRKNEGNTKIEDLEVLEPIEPTASNQNDNPQNTNNVNTITRI